MKVLKKFIGICLIQVVIFISPVFGQGNCTIEIEPETFIIDGNQLGIEPGDVVCLKGGEKDYLLIQNIHGTAENPVLVINSGSAVTINTDNYYGIKISHCSYIKFSGNGVDGINYGIYVKRVANGAGLSVGDLSTDVEVENIEISNTAIAGVYAKTDPTCNDFSATRDKFTMYNFVMHDCYLHDINDEGFYIGSSKYTGQHLNDCDTTVLPHVMIGTKIYNNIVENTGWDGIQVSSAEHDCEVYGNSVHYDSYQGWPGQMSGILIGGGSRCKVYNNMIFDGKGDGIDLFGLGSQVVFNNLIVRAGKTYHPNNETDFKHGIFVGKVPGAIAYGELNKIFCNTLISPKSFGITYSNDSINVKVYNNAIIKPGYTDAGENAYININVDESNVSIKNNFRSDDVYSAQFISVSNDNYDIQPTSPLVNGGTDISNDGISFDIKNRKRPFGTGYDIGAYECQISGNGIDEISKNRFKIIPVPANDFFTVNFKKEQYISYLKIVDITGKTIFKKLINNKIKSLKVNIPEIKEGNYIIVLTDDNNYKSAAPLVVKHYE